MSEVNDPRAWMEHAEEDYLLARSALKRKRPLIFSACFHAQQCAEKYLKAILIAKKVPFPKTHDLILLSNLCERAGIFLGMDAKDLQILSDYAVRTRYPGMEPIPDEGREALELASAIRKFSRAVLGRK